MQDAGYIYLMCVSTGFYKITMSVQPDERLWSLRTELPADAQLVYIFPADAMRSAERALHHKFRGKNHEGEWFGLGDEDVRWIKSIYKFSAATHGFELRATQNREDDVKRLVQLVEGLGQTDAFARDENGVPLVSMAELGLIFHSSLLHDKYGTDYLDEEVDVNDPLVSWYLRRCETALKRALEDGLLKQDVYISVGPNR